MPQQLTKIHSIPGVLIALFTIFISSCTAYKHTVQDRDMLFKNFWYLESASHLDLPTGELPAKPYLEFNYTNYSGNTVCSIINGTHSLIDPNLVTFNDIRITGRDCGDNDYSNFDKKYIAELKKSNRWKIENGKLHLMTNNSVLLIFTAVSK